MEWHGRIAIVTGAASGIGAAVTGELASRGVHVIGIDVDAAGLSEVLDAVTRSGGTATADVVDVSERDAVAQMAARVEQAHGRLDFAVNCAGSFIARGLDADTDDWERVLGVNVRGISNIVQAAEPLLSRSEGAAIVNTASVSAHVAQPSRWTYNATKGAIVTLTKCMAMDLAPKGIRVNVVSPGWIWTPEVSRAAGGDRERWEPVWGRFHLLRRLGEPVEVAKAIAFLCSSDASFITGAELAVDGGYLAMGAEGLGDDSSFAGSV
jgi:NAD(P)-dependent dehydrogenase (short-subunit alcohol dehydrogenase family)